MTAFYEEPALDKDAFNCPYCTAYAHFHWSSVNVSVGKGVTAIDYRTARCGRCARWTMWTRGGTLIEPAKLTSPLAHPDLPEACQSEYEEARKVLPHSPRASAALLRLCIQKLCKELGASGKDITADIAKLVKDGLDAKIQKALDIVRVTGNNAVHPGTLDLQDDPARVSKLFKVVNLIVEEMITKPKEIEDLYGGLPDRAKQAIQKRDG